MASILLRILLTEPNNGSCVRYTGKYSGNDGITALRSVTINVPSVTFPVPGALLFIIPMNQVQSASRPEGEIFLRIFHTAAFPRPSILILSAHRMLQVNMAHQRFDLLPVQSQLDLLDLVKLEHRILQRFESQRLSARAESRLVRQTDIEI